jgi:ADP-ribose pyrophosphatase YjhB (NUDIX family)
MVIQRCPGWVLLQTKQHYPPGLFRLPTGSVHSEETVAAAMLRELHEEANLVPGGHRRLARLDYLVEDGRCDFFTEIFLIEGPRGELQPNDPKEAINAWREAPVSELSRIAGDLRSLEPPRQAWGLFRSVLHDVVPGLVPTVPPSQLVGS